MALTRGKVAITALIVGLFAPISIQSAQAVDTVFYNNQAANCGGCYDNQNITNGANQWAAWLMTVDAAATVTKVEVYFGNTASEMAGSIIGIYSDQTQSPNDPSRLLGTLTYSSATVPTTGRILAEFTGSVSISSAGVYWFRFSDVATGKSTWLKFGTITGQTGTWSAYQGNPNLAFFNNAPQRNTNYHPAFRVSGTAGGGGGSGGSDVTKTAAELAAEARKNHEEQVNKSLGEIKSALSGGNRPTKSQFDSADINGVTDFNLTFINSELDKLPKADRSNINNVKTIVLKYATVDLVAQHRFVSAKQLIETGLMEPTATFKMQTIAKLGKLPTTSLETVEKLKAEIAAIEATNKARKDHLAEVLAKYGRR